MSPQRLVNLYHANEVGEIFYCEDRMGMLGEACKVIFMGVVALQAGCKPAEQVKSKWREKIQADCLDKVCPGEIEPEVGSGEAVLKINNEYFAAPREYVKGASGLAFYWPSKTPVAGPRDGGAFPEYGGKYDEVAISIFLRSNNIPPEPHGFSLVKMAEAKGWVESRKTLRPGLDSVKMRHVIGPGGYYLDRLTYYVATNINGFDGLPPVAGCNHDDPRNGGGGGFMWQSSIWVGISMNQRHCFDWPEIYQEAARVLNSLRKV